MMYGHGWSWLPAVMWIFWIVLIIVVLLLIRSQAVSVRGLEASRESAEEILKKRYARGEIDKDEYEHKLSDLRC
jgi:putative membrane protein